MPWEEIGPETDGHVFDALSDEGLAKMPMERLLPHMSDEQFEKVDLNRALEAMSSGDRESLPWDTMASKITPKQMEELSPGKLHIFATSTMHFLLFLANVDQMAFQRMWPFMQCETIEVMSGEQFATMKTNV